MNRHFDENAKNWDSEERVKMAESIASAMIAALNPGAGHEVIDFGAGTGLISFNLARLVKKVFALDNSNGMLETLKEKISAAGIKNIIPAYFDAESAKKPAIGADFFVSSMAMHHVEDLKKFAELAFYMLKPGGAAAIADLEKEDGGFHKDAAAAGAKHRGFEKEHIKRLFSEAGFTGIEFSGAYTAKRISSDGSGKAYPIFLMTARKPAA